MSKRCAIIQMDADRRLKIKLSIGYAGTGMGGGFDAKGWGRLFAIK
jgi:hypothetical protein